MSNDGDEIVHQWNRGRGVMLSLFGFCLTAAGLLGVFEILLDNWRLWHVPESPKPKRLVGNVLAGLIFIGPCVVVGLLVAYAGIAHLLNRTVVGRAGSRLIARSSPIRWPRNAAIPIGRLRGIEVRQALYRINNGRPPWHVVAVGNGLPPQVLIGSVSEARAHALAADIRRLLPVAEADDMP